MTHRMYHTKMLHKMILKYRDIKTDTALFFSRIDFYNFYMGTLYPNFY